MVANAKLTAQKHPDAHGKFECGTCHVPKSKRYMISRPGTLYGIGSVCKKCHTAYENKRINRVKEKSPPKLSEPSEKVSRILKGKWI